MNSIEKVTPKTFVKTISIIHFALLGGIIMFGAFVYFQNNNWILNIENTEDIFLMVVPLTILAGVLMGSIIYRKKVNSLKDRQSLKEKLTGFQEALILKYALIEGPAFLSIVAAMLTGNSLYLIISGVLVLYMLSLKPTQRKIEQGLELSRAMRDELSGK